MTRPLVRGLSDTPLILDIQAGESDPLLFAADVIAAGLPFELSQASALAVRSWCPTPWDLAQFRVFLAAAVVHTLTAKITDRAHRLLDRIPPPGPLSADDALVAATALAHKLPLYTTDPGRFAGVPGLVTIRPH